jgi:pimeloyl-ACP methyl ester carboxylesterase
MMYETFTGSRFQSRFLEILQTEKTLDDSGKLGLPRNIVLIHGLYQNTATWQEFAVRCSAFSHVIAPNVLGHNPESPIPLGTKISIEQMADEIVELTEASSMGRAVFVGHSMGGAIALQIAKRHPDNVQALCLFHATPFADTPQAQRDRDKAIEQVKDGKKSAVIQALWERMISAKTRTDMPYAAGHLREILDRVPESGMVAALGAMRDREDTTDVLKNAAFPVLFIIGKDDVNINVEAVLKASQLPKTSLVCLLADVAHAGMIEAPEVCARAIEALVEIGYASVE